MPQSGSSVPRVDTEKEPRMFLSIDMGSQHLDLAALHHAALRRANPNEPALARLRHYVGMRDDLVIDQTAWRNRQQAAQWAGVREGVTVVKRRLTRRAGLRYEVEAQIATLLATRAETAALTSLVGVGPLTAAAVLASLPAGVLGNPKAAASAGIHPRREQSGQRDRSRLSQQGRPELRRYLYLAAISAMRWDPQITAWYRTLCARGKAPMSAICAVGHKLLRRMMDRVREARADIALPLPLAA